MDGISVEGWMGLFSADELVAMPAFRAVVGSACWLLGRLARWYY